MGKWRYPAAVLALVLLLAGGLNLAAHNIRLIRGDQEKYNRDGIKISIRQVLNSPAQLAAAGKQLMKDGFGELYGKIRLQELKTDTAWIITYRRMARDKIQSIREQLEFSIPGKKQ